jgi:hypothetical protein
MALLIIREVMFMYTVLLKEKGGKKGVMNDDKMGYQK